MSLDASIPKALYQANIDLALRIAALLQENGKQWFDLFAEEASTRLEEGLSQAGSLGQGMSLEKLAALPADAATQFLQIDVGRWQTLLSHAVDNQSQFAHGVQEALSQWQDACSGAFDAVALGRVPELPAGLAVLPGLSDMAASIRRFMAQAIPGAEPAMAARKPSPAPAPQAAAKKSVPAKAAAKKAAAKKAAPKQAPPKQAAAKKQPARKAAAKKPEVKAPAVKKSTKTAKSAPRKFATKTAAPLAPALAPKPLPALVTASRRSRKPA